jgi:hypothetical protein
MIWGQAVLSDDSSKRPSGVAAELEWDRVTELGEAAIEAAGQTRPGLAITSKFSHASVQYYCNSRA